MEKERTTILDIKNLKTDFQIHKTRITAVRGVTLHMEQGDILAIVGESGSGKSVTMKSVMGILGENAHVSADSLTVLDRDMLADLF